MINSPWTYFVEYLEVDSMPVENEFYINENTDYEELELLEKIISVSQNKLKRYEDKVCSYRSVEKIKVKE